MPQPAREPDRAVGLTASLPVCRPAGRTMNALEAGAKIGLRFTLAACVSLTVLPIAAAAADRFFVCGAHLSASPLLAAAAPVLIAATHKPYLANWSPGDVWLASTTWLDGKSACLAGRALAGERIGSVVGGQASASEKRAAADKHGGQVSNSKQNLLRFPLIERRRRRGQNNAGKTKTGLSLLADDDDDNLLLFSFNYIHV